MYKMKWPLHTLSLLLLLLLSACGSYNSTESSGMGSIAFSIDWQGAPTLAPSNASNLAPQAAPLDCTTGGVSNISATVYWCSTCSGIAASGGPWPCSAHSGSITNVTAGVRPGMTSPDLLKVVILGVDSSGNTIYQGDISDVIVTAGQTTNAGAVVMSRLLKVTTVAGTVGATGSTDGTGTATRFYSPQGIATDGTNLFVADSSNNTIRKIVISTGVVIAIAGTAGSSGSADGTGSAARFNTPNAITTDGTNLFVADTGNNTIRKIVISSGVVTTIAGSAGFPGSIDGAGTAASFYSPQGIATDGTNLFVADSSNNTIRKIVISTGVVTTIAGTAGVNGYGSTDGTGTAARFGYPQGIATDGTNLFVADTGNNTIRKIVISTGVVTTIAGTAGSSGSADGTGSAARFNAPNAITTDGTNLFVADTGNNTIRKIQ